MPNITASMRRNSQRQKRRKTFFTKPSTKERLRRQEWKGFTIDLDDRLPEATPLTDTQRR